MLHAALLTFTLAAQAHTATRVAASEPAPATMALVETFADGRVNYELVAARPAWSWTPMFPRIENFVLPEGMQPLRAVQFDRILATDGIHVTVSVLLGTAHVKTHVADYILTPGSRVRVAGLEKYGARAIELSVTQVAPIPPFMPTVISDSAEIEVSNVEIRTAPYPGYRITLRNLSTKAAANFSLQSYRGGEKALSALKRSDDGRPIMMPGASYTFDVPLTSGAGRNETPGTWTPRPLDIIEIDSVRWADGSYHGVPRYPQTHAAITADSGRRLQLTRIITALREAMRTTEGWNAVALARDRVAALPEAEVDQLAAAQDAMRATRLAALSDIARYQAARGGDLAPGDWLQSTLAKYQDWLTRLLP